MNRLEGRLARLERNATAAWEAWIGVPVKQWPDEAIDAHIRYLWPLPPDAELTDEMIDARIAELEQSAGGEMA